jgi:hypothetical protein
MSSLQIRLLLRQLSRCFWKHFACLDSCVMFFTKSEAVCTLLVQAFPGHSQGSSQTHHPRFALG